MSTHRPFPRVLGLAAAGLVAACGSSTTSPNQPDPFYGGIDAKSVVAPLFLSSGAACAKPGVAAGASSCALSQTAFAAGAPVTFYNAGAFTSTAGLKFSTTSLAITGGTNKFGLDVFDPGCSPAAPVVASDGRTTLYNRDSQYSIFSSLPFANALKPTAAIFPLAAETQVTGASGETCNDLKDANSVSDNHLGVQLGNALGTDVVALLPDLGQTAVQTLPGLSIAPKLAWSGGFLTRYLDGGAVPTDASGNLKFQDGVLLNTGAGSTSNFSNNAVILSAAPGQPGYSPIVRLWDVDATLVGKTIGTVTGLCTTKGCAVGNPALVELSLGGTAAAPDYSSRSSTYQLVPAPKTAKISSTYTLFIISSAT